MTLKLCKLRPEPVCADAVNQHLDDDEDEEGEVDDVDEDEGHLIGGDSRAAQV